MLTILFPAVALNANPIQLMYANAFLGVLSIVARMGVTLYAGWLADSLNRSMLLWGIIVFLLPITLIILAFVNPREKKVVS